MKRQTICVDFDGVIHSYTSGWKGAATIPDPPVPGAMEWLTKLTDEFDVVVCSSRARRLWGWIAIRFWLRKHMTHHWGAHATTAWDALDQIRVTCRKPAASVYIDDRAWRFDGSHWPTSSELRAHRPWFQKAPD
jgi:hypothetical protein